MVPVEMVAPPPKRRLETKIAVGPSAPPMIAIEAASDSENPRHAAPMNVRKIPA